MSEFSVFVGREEVKTTWVANRWAAITIEAEDLVYYEFDDMYIPSAVEFDTFVLYLLYDHNLVKDFTGQYIHKVIYTDILSYDKDYPNIIDNYLN